MSDSNGNPGGGAMSGRGAEQGEGWKAQERDAHEQAERNKPDEGVGGGGVAGAGTGGGGLGGDSSTREATASLGGDAGGGAGASGPATADGI